MPNSLYPAFVQINYNSAFGVHRMTIPTLEYFPADEEFATHAGGRVGFSPMIGNLVAEFLPFFTAAVSFNNWTIFTMASPAADPLPQLSLTMVGQVGTAVTSAWIKASQFTVTMRTSLFGIFKIVLLDCDSGDDWDLQLSSTTPSDFTGIIGEVTADTNAWAGRDGGQPMSFLQCSKTLNEKLRRAYRMT